MEDEAERLDLVDENDKVIATVSRVDYYAKEVKPKGYLRSAALFIRNDQGQLWIPRRTVHRKIAPGGLDYSAAGHVSSGEDYLASLIREIKEELNMAVASQALRFIKKFHPTKEQPWFRCLYLYSSNIVPNYNRDDFSEYYWLTPEQLLARLEKGEPSKLSLPFSVRATLDQLTLP